MPVPILFLLKGFSLHQLCKTKFTREDLFSQTSSNDFSSRGSPPHRILGSLRAAEPQHQSGLPRTPRQGPALSHRQAARQTEIDQKNILTEGKLLFKHMPNRQLTLTGTGGKRSMVSCSARHEQALEEYKVGSSPKLKTKPGIRQDDSHPITHYVR